MDKNKTILFLTTIAAILIIAFPTIYKIYQGHEEREYEVATKKILEGASLCYQEQVCTKSEMTLKEFQEAGYVDPSIVNPRTQTYFDEQLILVEENFSVTFQK